MTGARIPAAGLARRSVLKVIAGGAAALALPEGAGANNARKSAHQKTAHPPFEAWIAAFRAKAIARGIAPETYDSVMTGLTPDRTGLEAIHNQPEFSVKLWQYLNRATSDWKIAEGQEKAKEYAALLAHIEHDYGVGAQIEPPHQPIAFLCAR